MKRIGWLGIVPVVLLMVALACQSDSSSESLCQRHSGSGNADECERVLQLAEERPQMGGIQHVENARPVPLAVARMTREEFETEVQAGQATSNPELVDMSGMLWVLLFEGRWLRPPGPIPSDPPPGTTPEALEAPNGTWDLRIVAYDPEQEDFVSFSFFSRETIGEMDLSRFDVDLS